MTTNIGIIGAGTMGSGIAELAALSTFDVYLHDLSLPMLTSAVDRIAKSLAKAVEKKRIGASDAAVANQRIHIAQSLKDLKSCGFVVEAALEDMNVKRDLFQQLDALLAPSAILASNTSSLSITAIGATTKRPAQVIGMHFFNPPTLMKLVEVINGAHTSEETSLATAELASQLGKTPVVCQDTPGFIVNRVARPFYGEALRLLGEGVADVATIDKIAREIGGFKMGPFELMDLIGIDVNYAVTQSVYEQFFHEPRFRPHPIQRQMVAAGRLGLKTKKGFYSYNS